MDYQLIWIGVGGVVLVFAITFAYICYHEWLARRRRAQLKHRTRKAVAENR